MLFGLGQQKPHHYREMARAAWENLDQLPYAWRILRDGVCDGCALGTSGLSDWTIPGVHLCMVRLELMRLNTAPALDPGILSDVASLRSHSSHALRALGRLPEPLLRRAGEAGFLVASWDEALNRIASELATADPARVAFYVTSRGVTNESYYAAQKAARFLGSHHVDTSARFCHAASTTAMRRTLGYGASTCSYSDWLHADLIVLFGSNVANNQPVTIKYLYEAKKNGAEIAVVNPYREPGLARYWVPSIPQSALFGTRLADRWFDVNTGGDLAFLIGTLRALVENGGVDEVFIRDRTVGFDAARDRALTSDWELLERESGASRESMVAFARLLMDKPDTVLVWSMGLTQHAHGVETIKAVVNIGLARGLLGRPNAGLVPIRGHSGVQGGAEVGCQPDVDAATAERWSKVWEFPVLEGRGWSAAEMIDRSAAGEVDVFWIVGGNFLETVADPDKSRRALNRPRLRIHHDIVLSSSMLVDAAGDVLILPAATRYECEGGGTETSTERRIIFSPEIPGRRIGSARPEWQVFGEVMARARPKRANDIRFESAAAIREEIAKAIPLYRGIETLKAKGDQVQWGGRTLYADGRFATPDGKAHFSPVGPRTNTVRLQPDDVTGARSVRLQPDDVTGARSVRLQPDDVTGIRSVRLQPDDVTGARSVRLQPDDVTGARSVRLQPDDVTGIRSVRLQPDDVPTFLVSTRRGKQFNSMVQRAIDPLNGAHRDAVLINKDDVNRLGLRENLRVRLRSADGTFEGRLKLAPIKAGNLEVHWPEGNTLLSGSSIDPDSMEPDFNAVVTLEAL